MKAVTIVNIALVFLVVVGIPFAWILRDGLGPNSIESTGVKAMLQTFWTFYIGPLTIFVLGVWLVLFGVSKKRNLETCANANV